ncbi:unnamed protein product [Caretta caretta]
MCWCRGDKLTSFQVPVDVQRCPQTAHLTYKVEKYQQPKGQIMVTWYSLLDYLLQLVSNLIYACGKRKEKKRGNTFQKV